jgi:formylglycine-generating enzyme required for sulfatase activity
MDETEITNSQYKQFVYWVRDSIIRERIADPRYAGDDLFKITEDAYGDPVTPHLNWSIPIPWSRNTEEEEAAINSLYVTHPITGQKMLDAAQLNFRYEWFDAAEAARRQQELNRVQGTTATAGDQGGPAERVMITKDTAYVAFDGWVVNETITRPLSTLYDFVHTRIVNIYPDTTAWVNDFHNANNEVYMRNYFSHPAYAHHPVVNVNWEQATAFCEWRTMYLRRSIRREGVIIEKYRLPTEAEWELAARNANSDSRYPWENGDDSAASDCYQANFNPGEGAYAADNHLIPARVRSFKPNQFGLYEMAGNVAEWTSTAYSGAGLELMNDLNPDYRYNAMADDPAILKRKVVKGGSWKDNATFIRSDMRDMELQQRGRSWIGFRCVRTQVSTGK